MTTAALFLMTRPRRRTHLVWATGTGTLCGTPTPVDHIHPVPITISGGATSRLRTELMVRLDGNACIPCTRIAVGMLALYAARDSGRPA